MMIYVYIYIEGRHLCIYATGENFAWRFHGDHSTNYPYRLSGAARCPCITWHKLIALLRRWVFWPKFSAETSFERHFFHVGRGHTDTPYLYSIYILEPKWPPCFGWNFGLVLWGWPSKIEVSWVLFPSQVGPPKTYLEPKWPLVFWLEKTLVLQGEKPPK